jgi:hypothetical protein
MSSLRSVLSQLGKINLRNCTLTIRGFLVYGTDKTTNMTTKRFDWENALIDATITAAVTFFSTLGGGSVAGLEGMFAIKAAIVSALTQFFVFLALKRGIMTPKQTNTTPQTTNI